MSCNSRAQITILPGDCLGKQIIKLPCKSPVEAVFYSFSVVKRMKAVDLISQVIGQPSDPMVIIDQITFTGQTFKCRISGGTLNTKSGIRFVITTQKGETIEFVCVLPVMAEGILSQEAEEKIILGDTGPAGTISIGKISTVSADQPAAVTNVGTPSTAILNIDIPQGEKGDTGSRWYSGSETPTDQTGAQDPRGTPRPGDMYLYLDSDGHGASTYILTNDALWQGPLATVVGPQGPQGIQGPNGKDGINPTLSIGTVTSLAADQQATAEIISGENGKNTLNLALVKGEMGEKGESYKNDGSAELDVKNAKLKNIEIFAESSTIPAYIDWHNSTDKDYTARTFLTESGSLIHSGHVLIQKDLASAKNLTIQGTTTLDNGTIKTDGTGQLNFKYSKTGNNIITVDSNKGIDIDNGASLTLKNNVSDGSEKSARLRYTGTPEENIISIDSEDAKGATLAINQARIDRVISTWNDNIYTRLCPVIYDASINVGSGDDLPTTVTTGYVVACKNFIVNDYVIPDIVLIRAKKDYPQQASDWDLLAGLPFLNNGTTDLDIKSIKTPILEVSDDTLSFENNPDEENAGSGNVSFRVKDTENKDKNLWFNLDSMRFFVR